MRTPAQRGRYGRWLVAAREARGFDTAEKALKALAAAGIHIGKSTYAEYESGAKVPSRNHLPLLIEFWGEVSEPETSADQAALIAAMTGALLAQTQALTDLRTDLVEARDSARSERRAMTKMLARLEARLAEFQPPGGTGSAAADQASGHR